MAIASESQANSSERGVSKAEVDNILDNNLTEQFELLRGTPGYCLQTLTWETAKSLIREGTEQSLGKLGRHPASCVIYRQFRRKVLEEFASILDFVKVTIMGYPYNLDSGGKKIVHPSQSYTCPPRWRLNDFPYNLENGVEHHNLWASVPMSEDALVQEIERHRQGYEYVYWVNPGPLASIPELWHAHIISRKR